MNECSSSPCGDGAKCLNIAGSFKCSCPSGYSGDPHDGCYDINECSNSGSCGINAKCLNVPGSYKCLCPHGFSGHGHLFCES